MENVSQSSWSELAEIEVFRFVHVLLEFRPPIPFFRISAIGLFESIDNLGKVCLVDFFRLGQTIWRST